MNNTQNHTKKTRFFCACIQILKKTIKTLDNQRQVVYNNNIDKRTTPRGHKRKDKTMKEMDLYADELVKDYNNSRNQMDAAEYLISEARKLTLDGNYDYEDYVDWRDEMADVAIILNSDNETEMKLKRLALIELTRLSDIVDVFNNEAD